VPQACDPDTYLLAGLGSYCATAKQSQPTSVVPVGDTRYLVAHNQGLHGIWLYDSDDPTFKLTVLPKPPGGKQRRHQGGRKRLLRAERRGAAERADPVHPADQGVGFDVRL